jgi:hypothetical protein
LVEPRQYFVETFATAYAVFPLAFRPEAYDSVVFRPAFLKVCALKTPNVELTQSFCQLIGQSQRRRDNVSRLNSARHWTAPEFINIAASQESSQLSGMLDTMAGEVMWKVVVRECPGQVRLAFAVSSEVKNQCVR